MTHATPFLFYRGIDSNGVPVIVVRLGESGRFSDIILPKSEVERLKQCCVDSLEWLNSDTPISTINVSSLNAIEEIEASRKRIEEYQAGLR